jgi:hydrogenase maturation protease
VLVVGLGNELRADDGAGLEIVRRLAADDLPAEVRVRQLPGEPLGLLELWAGSEAVVLIDAVRSGADAGTIHRLDASSGPLPAQLTHSSSHAVSLSETIELARGLGRLPPVVLVLGVEGGRFDIGGPLSDAVRDALERATEIVARAASALALRPGWTTDAPPEPLSSRS